jgi:hypothetical protein
VLGVAWPATDPGEAAFSTCPGSSQGTTTRICCGPAANGFLDTFAVLCDASAHSGTWMVPSYIGCMSEPLRSFVHTALNAPLDPAEALPLAQQAARYASLLAPHLGAADVQLLVRLLEHLRQALPTEHLNASSATVTILASLAQTLAVLATATAPASLLAADHATYQQLQLWPMALHDLLARLLPNPLDWHTEGLLLSLRGAQSVKTLPSDSATSCWERVIWPGAALQHALQTRIHPLRSRWTAVDPRHCGSPQPSSTAMATDATVVVWSSAELFARSQDLVSDVLDIRGLPPASVVSLYFDLHLSQAWLRRAHQWCRKYHPNAALISAGMAPHSALTSSGRSRILLTIQEAGREKTVQLEGTLVCKRFVPSLQTWQSTACTFLSASRDAVACQCVGEGTFAVAEEFADVRPLLAGATATPAATPHPTQTLVIVAEACALVLLLLLLLAFLWIWRRDHLSLTQVTYTHLTLALLGSVTCAQVFAHVRRRLKPCASSGMGMGGAAVMLRRSFCCKPQK